MRCEACQLLRRREAAVTMDDAISALGLPRRIVRDETIERVCRAIDRDPGRFRTLEDAAALASLSPSRFRARFMAETGITFRRYRLWRRMAVAMTVVAGGATLTTAAHRASFSSSAHLSTSFKAMFGMSPSSLVRSGVVICGGGVLSDDAFAPRGD